MSRFLFTTLQSNDLGLLTRSLPIAGELAKRGHKVAFCSPGPAPSRLIAEAGLENLLPKHPVYHLMTAEPNLRGLYHLTRTTAFKRDFGNVFSFLRQLIPTLPFKIPPPTAKIWNLDHISAMSGMLNEGFVRTHVAALMDTMVEWQADVIVDFWNPLACMAARALHKPLVTVIQADMHPDSRGFIWWQDPPPDIPSPVPAINPVLATHGLKPVNSTSELCVGDLTLVMGTPETDPLPDGADVTYVGPILWQNPAARLPDWASELRQDQPVVWVYSGNPQYMPGIRTPVDSAIILEACIAALAGREVQVVLTTGHHALSKRLLPLPANFRYEDYVPGLAMAERSDLLVHHGGYGSCQTGLYTGTPAVIIPTFSERESNARRIAAAGAGEYLVPSEGKSWRKVVEPQALWAKMEQVLSEPSYRTNAMRIREKLRTYGGASDAADRIERFCQLSTQLSQPG